MWCFFFSREVIQVHDSRDRSIVWSLEGRMPGFFSFVVRHISCTRIENFRHVWDVLVELFLSLNICSRGCWACFTFVRSRRRWLSLFSGFRDGKAWINRKSQRSDDYSKAYGHEVYDQACGLCHSCDQPYRRLQWQADTAIPEQASPTAMTMCTRISPTLWAPLLSCWNILEAFSLCIVQSILSMCRISSVNVNWSHIRRARSF